MTANAGIHRPDMPANRRTRQSCLAPTRSDRMRTQPLPLPSRQNEAPLWLRWRGGSRWAGRGCPAMQYVEGARERGFPRLPGCGEAGRTREMFAVVPDDCLENHLDTQQVELFREVERIRILTEGSQQLRANGDDLGVHG